MALSRFDIPVLPVGGVRWQRTGGSRSMRCFPIHGSRWCYAEDTEKDETEWLYLGGISAGTSGC